MPPTAKPDASVLIPTHNRRDLLLRLLDSLAKQTHDPGSFEVVIADDGSTDDTAEALKRLETPLQARVLTLGSVGQSAARNAAIEASRAPLCILLDDDVIASPELVAAHLAAHRENGRIAGIGALAQLPYAGRGWYAQAFARGWARHYARLEHEPARWPDCYGGNFSASREALLEVGGFATDVPTSKDIEIGFRLEEHGYQPTFIPRAAAVHDDQKPPDRLLADVVRQGAGYVGLAKRFPKMAPTLLGSFRLGSPRELALRRLLIALRFPPRVLVAIGAIVPSNRGQDLWYEFVRKLTFWRAARGQMSRREWSQITRGLPILMYHAFSAKRERERYIMPSRSFVRQLRLLRALRYEVVPLEEFVDALRTGRRLRRRAVVLTIDDGYEDNVSVAQRALRELGLPATLFLVTQRLGADNDWSKQSAVAGRPLLSCEQVKQASAEGLEFGAHTRRHHPLPDTEDAVLQEEVSGSREDLEALLGKPVGAFAYPYGFVDGRAMTAVRGAGFDVALSVDDRRATIVEDPMRVPRIEICGTDSPLRFLRKLWL
ncbi:MAG TPA: glycosyltransferase [Solirubrobacterales bacterium]|jgi:GT2 family glycosyltransferase/peptidoglycan/xylan/chitin deacetylase (PgdA/CDA1 family)